MRKELATGMLLDQRRGPAKIRLPNHSGIFKLNNWRRAMMSAHFER